MLCQEINHATPTGVAAAPCGAACNTLARLVPPGDRSKLVQRFAYSLVSGVCVTTIGLGMREWWLFASGVAITSTAILFAVCSIIAISLDVLNERYSWLAEKIFPGTYVCGGPNRRWWGRQMRSTPIPTPPNQDSNPHGRAARARAIARTHMLSVARASGLPIYMISLSNKDISEGLSGTRRDYNVKDAASYVEADQRDDPVPDGPYVEGYVDVADQISSGELAVRMCNQNAVIALATQQFRKVAGKDEDVPFRYLPDSEEFVYEVPGSTYQHKFYSWEGETRTTWTWWHATSLLGRAGLAISITLVALCLLQHYRAVGVQYLFLGMCYAFSVMFYFPTAVSYDFDPWAGRGIASYIPRIDITWGATYYPHFVECPTISASDILHVSFIACMLVELLCFRAKAVTRKLEQVDIGEHRSVIFMVPTKTYGTIRTVMMQPFISDGLIHLRPTVVGEPGSRLIGMRIKDGERTRVNIAAEGFTYSVDADDELGSIITTLHRLAPKTAPSGSNIQTVAGAQASKLKVTGADASLAASFFLACRNPISVSAFIRAVEPLHEYNIGRSYTAGDQSGMRTFVQPFVSGGCYAARRNLANETATTTHRVESMRNYTELCPRMDAWMNEFVHHFREANTIGRVTLWEDEVVYEKQHRPMQRSILDRVREFYRYLGSRTATTFQKAEAMKAASPARVITQCDPVTRFLGSKVVYPFTSVVKTMPWYAFGKSPKQVGEAMAKLYVGAQTAADGDYTNMDGSIGNIHRELERRLYLATFVPEDHEIVLETLRDMYGNNVKCPFGTRYPQGAGQGSGFPDTSTGNTVRNAFVAYVARRLSGDDKENAWARLGLYGGDDGSTPDIGAKYLIDAATRVGQVLKVNILQRGERIPFLGRIYGTAFSGGSNSMCDFRRQILKIHATSRSLDVANYLVAHDKGVSGCVLDRNTPVIGSIYAKWADIPVRAGHDVLYEYSAGVAVNSGEDCENFEESWMWDVVHETWTAEQISTVIAYCQSSCPWENVPTVEHLDVLVKPGLEAEIDGIVHVTPTAPSVKGKEPDVSEEAVVPTGISMESASMAPPDPVNVKSKMSKEEFKSWRDKKYTPEERAAFSKLTPKQRSDKIAADRAARASNKGGGAGPPPS